MTKNLKKNRIAFRVFNYFKGIFKVCNKNEDKTKMKNSNGGKMYREIIYTLPVTSIFSRAAAVAVRNLDNLVLLLI